MDMEAQRGREAPHSFDHRDIGPDRYFLTDSLSDTALTATQLTDKQFDRDFPGWPLYRVIAAHDRTHYNRVAAFAIAMGWGIAQSRKASRNSHPVIAKRKRGDWIIQASLDALYFAVHKQWPVGAHLRAPEGDVHIDLYTRIRDAVAEGLVVGFETYRAALLVNFWRARRLESMECG